MKGGEANGSGNCYVRTHQISLKQRRGVEEKGSEVKTRSGEKIRNRKEVHRRERREVKEFHRTIPIRSTGKEI